MFFSRPTGHKYIDRGDPAAHDFAVGDLTANGNWHDLDLSSVIPKSAKLVILSVITRNGATGSTIQFRKKGNSDALNISLARCFIANANIYSDIIVSPNTTGVIEYLATAVVFEVLSINVRGWFA